MTDVDRSTLRKMRTYAAEDRAVLACPLPPLDGTAKSAQQYVDRITRSAWWRRNCPPSWLGDESGAVGGFVFSTTQPPRRIIVHVTRGSWGWAHVAELRQHRGKWHPIIRLGANMPKHGEPRSSWPHPPAQSQWVILHEVAHILAACRDESERGHGRVFRTAYLDLVRRWAGPAAARALADGYKAEGLKYRRQS